MPFWGLVLTSAGFIVPSILAFHRKLWFQTASCGIISLTSIAYHGTVHPIAKYIDMAFAHALSVGWLCEGFWRVIFVRSTKDVVVLTMAVGSMLIYLIKSRNNFNETSKLWHMTFHCMCQSTCYVYLLTN